MHIYIFLDIYYYIYVDEKIRLHICTKSITNDIYITDMSKEEVIKICKKNDIHFIWYMIRLPFPDELKVVYSKPNETVIYFMEEKIFRIIDGYYAFLDYEDEIFNPYSLSMMIYKKVHSSNSLTDIIGKFRSIEEFRLELSDALHYVNNLFINHIIEKIKDIKNRTNVSIVGVDKHNIINNSNFSQSDLEKNLKFVRIYGSFSTVFGKYLDIKMVKNTLYHLVNDNDLVNYTKEDILLILTVICYSPVINTNYDQYLQYIKNLWTSV